MNTLLRRPARAFTLLEVVVVVAIVALLSLIIAGVFDTVGKTLDVGKRVSLLNANAARIYRQMRVDFESITREGFMVIRNEYANNGQPVELFEGDADRRPRRIDEIMFFTQGDYVTQRRALHPDMIAEATRARVYYGHGTKAIPDFETEPLRNPFLFPALNDRNLDEDQALGYARNLGPGEVENPNRYAADWSLLRHLTLLVPPNESAQRLPRGQVFGIGSTDPAAPLNEADYRRLADTVQQVALQPASQSVFRLLAAEGRPRGITNRDLAQNGTGIRQYPGSRNGNQNSFSPLGPFWPLATSGLVDIATTDLNEIRGLITRANLLPSEANNGNPWRDVEAAIDNAVRNAEYASLEDMQAWMRQALPSDPGPWVGSAAGNRSRERARIRYESEPPLMFFPRPANPGPAQELQRAWREADQEMLSASIFLPRCTEFIVEYSFGELIDDDNNVLNRQPIWYGLTRWQDFNDDRRINNGEVVVARAFEGSQKIEDELGITEDDQRELILGSGPGGQFVPRPENRNVPVTHHFGYFDPANGTPEEFRPWPWPRLIRVTMSFIDANDPDSVEQTYQAVFQIPASR